MTLDSKALQEKLKQLQGDQLDKIMAKAIREGAKVYQAAVSEAAPERVTFAGGDALPPGALKDDVIIKKAPSTGGPIYQVEFGKLTRHVARWVEYGHRLVRGGRSRVLKSGKTRGKGKEVGQVDAKPFFRDAFEAATEPAAKVISDSIFMQVSKAFKGK
jgi:hypothetical protein